MKEGSKRVVDPMRQAEIVLEACFGVEDVVLWRLKEEAEAAAAYVVEITTNRKKWIRDADIRRAQSVADFKMAAYEKELLRLYGDGQVNEEEEALARLDGLVPGLESPENVEERLTRYAGLHDSTDFHDPRPRNPLTGEVDEADDDDDMEPA